MICFGFCGISSAATQSSFFWLQQTWTFSETENANGDEQARYEFDPPNRHGADEFAEFFAVFSENPHLQLSDVFWPLQVFHIDPEDEGLHVAKTVYYAAPQTYTKGDRSLFPTKAEREAAELECRISLHDARQGPQAAAVLMDADSRMLYIYVFQWYGGWYLLEVSDLRRESILDFLKLKHSAYMTATAAGNAEVSSSENATFGKVDI